PGARSWPRAAPRNCARRPANPASRTPSSRSSARGRACRHERNGNPVARDVQGAARHRARPPHPGPDPAAGTAAASGDHPQHGRRGGPAGMNVMATLWMVMWKELGDIARDGRSLALTLLLGPQLLPADILGKGVIAEK